MLTFIDVSKRISSNYYSVEELHIFKSDAIEAIGIKGHTDIDKIWKIAWDEQHSAGLFAVFDYLDRLAAMIREY